MTALESTSDTAPAHTSVDMKLEVVFGKGVTDAVPGSIDARPQ